MIVRKISETSTSITLGWDPVPGADGYVFYSAGIRRSKTMDPSRRSVKFSKGQEPYRVEAVKLATIDHGEYPLPKPPPPDPPPAVGYAPQSYNKGSRGQDAKYNTHINCTQQGNEFVDGHGIRYDDSGLCKGGRTGQYVEGLKPSDEMDSKEAWEPYQYGDVWLPPYPAKSYEQ